MPQISWTWPKPRRAVVVVAALLFGIGGGIGIGSAIWPSTTITTVLPAQAAQQQSATPSYLFSIPTSSGSLLGPNDQHLTLDLKGTRDYLTRFTNRPLRDAYVVANVDFERRFSGYFGTVPPNAVLTYTPVGSSIPVSLVLTVTDPHWNASTSSWTFVTTRIRKQPDNLPDTTVHITPPYIANPPSFGHATLFIDDTGSSAGPLATPAACAAQCPPASGSGQSNVDTAVGAGDGSYGFAPYFDMTDWPPPILETYTGLNGNWTQGTWIGYNNQTGTQYDTLAFIGAQSEAATGNSAPYECEPAWGSYSNYPAYGSNPYLYNTLGTASPTNSSGDAPYGGGVQAVQDDGGGVILSFGGEAADNTNASLPDVCTTASSLAAAYTTALDTYESNQSVKSIDFDIEGADANNAASYNLNWASVALMQQANPNLVVSVTLAAIQTGMTPVQEAVVQSAINAGVKLSIINLMAFDYSTSGSMTTANEDLLTSAESQIATLYPNNSSTQDWAMIGNTDMIGVWDTSTGAPGTAGYQAFLPSDATAMEAWDSSHLIGRQAMWVAGSDTDSTVNSYGTTNSACVNFPANGAAEGCSGVNQTDGQFGSIFSAFKGES